MGMIPRWFGRAKTERAAGSLESFGIPPLGAGSIPTALTVTSKNAMGVPAMVAAVKRASEQVAELEFGVWRGTEPMVTRVKSTWQARFFAGQAPNDQQTWFDFFSTIEESVSYRGNAFIWKNISGGRVVEAFALHPDQVLPLLYKAGRKYLVGVYPWFVDPTGAGVGFYEVDEHAITHVRGFGNGGRWMAPSPLDRERGGLAISSALAKIGHENASYSQGLGQRLAITFPGASNPTKVAEWRDKFKAQYESVANAGKVMTLTDGATASVIGMTMSDAQFIESMQYSVEDICRIIDVPPSIVWGGGSGSTARAVGPTTPEHELQRWLRYGLSPRLSRIENAFRSDPDWFPDGSPTFPAFATQNFVRGDLLSEAQILVQKVQSGILLPDEARAMEGLPDLPGGLGKIPQIVPVGGTPNPNGPAGDPKDGVSSPKDSDPAG
jgi:HK97 family phage portal protein